MIRRAFFVLVATVSVAVTAAGASAQSQPGGKSAPVTLTGDQLKAFLPGNTLSATNALGYDYTVNFKADGSMHGELVILPASDDGKWSVKGDTMCVQFNTWLDGKEACAAIQVTDSGAFIYNNLPAHFKNVTVPPASGAAPAPKPSST